MYLMSCNDLKWFSLCYLTVHNLDKNFFFNEKCLDYYKVLSQEWWSPTFTQLWLCMRSWTYFHWIHNFMMYINAFLLRYAVLISSHIIQVGNWAWILVNTQNNAGFRNSCVPGLVDRQYASSWANIKQKG